MTQPIEKFILIMCESCDDGENCHDVEDMRWHEGEDGVPVCKSCYGYYLMDQPDETPWEDLDKIELRVLKSGEKVGSYQ